MTAPRAGQGLPMSAAEKARRHRFRQFMDAYYFARYADLLALEAATAGYPAEVSAYVAERPPMVFKSWLIQSRGVPR